MVEGHTNLYDLGSVSLICSVLSAGFWPMISTQYLKVRVSRTLPPTPSHNRNLTRQDPVRRQCVASFHRTASFETCNSHPLIFDMLPECYLR